LNINLSKRLTEVQEEIIVLYEEVFSRRQFGVFISHSNEDKEFADGLFDSLDNIVEITPYMAEYFPKAGIDLKEKIARNLDESQFAIALLTQSGVASQWVNQEIGYARARKLHIIPVIEEGVKVQGFLEGVEYIKLDRGNFRDTISQVIYVLRSFIPRGHEPGGLHLRLSCERCVDDLGYKFNFTIDMPIQPHINEVIKQQAVFATKCPKCKGEIIFDPFTFKVLTK